MTLRALELYYSLIQLKSNNYGRSWLLLLVLLTAFRLTKRYPMIKQMINQ